MCSISSPKLCSTACTACTTLHTCLCWGMKAGGWFARDLDTLQRVGKVALQPRGSPGSIQKLLIPTDALQQADEAAQAAFRQVIRSEFWIPATPGEAIRPSLRMPLSHGVRIVWRADLTQPRCAAVMLRIEAGMTLRTAQPTPWTCVCMQSSLLLWVSVVSEGVVACGRQAFAAHTAQLW